MQHETGYFHQVTQLLQTLTNVVTTSRLLPEGISQRAVEVDIGTMLGLRADLGYYTFIFAPTKGATVLALLEKTCEQVAISPETAMGCRRTRFLQAEEGYYCTFSLKNKYLYQTELRYSLNQLHSQIKYVSCLTLNWEFTANLILTVILLYQLSTYQCIK